MYDNKRQEMKHQTIRVYARSSEDYRLPSPPLHSPSSLLLTGAVAKRKTTLLLLSPCESSSLTPSGRLQYKAQVHLLSQWWLGLKGMLDGGVHTSQLSPPLQHAAATFPATLVPWHMYTRMQKASGQMASHTRSWPHFQGTKVMPSGHFPSDQERPVCSKHDAIFAEVEPNGWCHCCMHVGGVVPHYVSNWAYVSPSSQSQHCSGGRDEPHR